MRWPFNKCDMIYLGLLLYYIFFNVTRLSIYDTCAAPVQIFLVAAQITFFLMIICLTLLKASDLPDLARKWLNYFIHFVITPVCLYLPIQGAIWQFINITRSPSCPAVKNLSFSIWTWIVCVLIVGLLFTFISFLKLKTWWRIYQFRRRMHQLDNLASSGDYARLNEMLLEAGDINDKVGLVAYDIDKIEKKDYQPSLSTMLTESDSQTCPICFDDFKIGDKTVSLPKCGHTYHPDCVNGWLLKNPLCPMCRSNVRSSLYNKEIEISESQNGGYRGLEDLEGQRMNGI